MLTSLHGFLASVKNRGRDEGSSLSKQLASLTTGSSDQPHVTRGSRQLVNAQQQPAVDLGAWANAAQLRYVLIAVARSGVAEVGKFW